MLITLTLAPLQGMHPDLTFLWGRLVRKGGTSASSIHGPSVIFNFQQLMRMCSLPDLSDGNEVNDLMLWKALNVLQHLTLFHKSKKLTLITLHYEQA